MLVKVTLREWTCTVLKPTRKTGYEPIKVLASSAITAADHCVRELDRISVSSNEEYDYMLRVTETARPEKRARIVTIACHTTKHFTTKSCIFESED